MKIFITGTAGFVGFHLANRLLDNGYEILGYDAVTDYYDQNLKRDRLKILKRYKNFSFSESYLEDKENLTKVIKDFEPEVIIHLAAQAGVRYSIEHPKSYVDSNLIGTFNLSEVIRKHPVKHFLFASTSSVYGSNKEMPFLETAKTDTQLSFYAATKKANESMLHSYSYLYKIPTTVFRFFTVYGPMGRPDLALFKFAKAILNEEPIDIYNNGEMSRDFTYIDDLTKSIELLLDKVPDHHNPVLSDSISDVAPFRILNIGNSDEVNLMDFINEIEKTLGKEAKKNFLPMQIGDVKRTLSDTSLLKNLINYVPDTSYKHGIKKFIEWYVEYHANSK